MTRISKPLRRLVLLALLLPLGAGCTALNQIAETAFLMSPEQEAALGRQLVTEVQKEAPLYTEDPAALSYVRALGARLVQAAPRTEQTFEFNIVDSEEVNAFALPGGHIYVNRGLLGLAENESELAGVLAHEIGHVAHRHAARRVSQSQSYGMLAQLALGDDPNQFAELAAGLAQSTVLLKNSRSDEHEADAVAVDMTIKAGISPWGMVRFFEKLQAMGSTDSRAAEFFSTHPLTSARIAQVEQIIERRRPSASLASDSEAFQAIDARYPPPAP